MKLWLTKNHFASMYSIELKTTDTWQSTSEIRMSLEFIQNFGLLSKRLLFFCNPVLGYCTDIRTTKETYEQAKESASDTWSYLTSRTKDDIDLDASYKSLSEFNLTAGRN